VLKKPASAGFFASVITTLGSNFSEILSWRYKVGRMMR
jgi:hypothetical protein